MKKATITKLKDYLHNRDDVLLGFLFGSQAHELSTQRSDWDIGIYVKPAYNKIEYDTGALYPESNDIWSEITKILHTDNVDLVVINSSSASIADAALRGMPLVIKNRTLFLELMLAVSKEAEDYRQTVKEYAEIYWRSRSLTDKDRELLNKRLIFLDSELRDIKQFRQLTRSRYQDEKNKMEKRAVEHWVENILMAIIDISKTVLASEKKTVPASYREMVETFCFFLGFPEETVERLSQWTKLRNLLTHEYLDLRWQEIKSFIDEAEPYVVEFLQKTKQYVEK